MRCASCRTNDGKATLCMDGTACRQPPPRAARRPQEMDALQHQEDVQAAALLAAQSSAARDQDPELAVGLMLGPAPEHALAGPEPAEQGAGSSSEATLHADGEDNDDEVSLVEDGWGYPEDMEYM